MSALTAYGMEIIVTIVFLYRKAQKQFTILGGGVTHSLAVLPKMQNLFQMDFITRFFYKIRL